MPTAAPDFRPEGSRIRMTGAGPGLGRALAPPSGAGIALPADGALAAE